MIKTKDCQDKKINIRTEIRDEVMTHHMKDVNVLVCTQGRLCLYWYILRADCDCCHATGTLHMKDVTVLVRTQGRL